MADIGSKVEMDSSFELDFIRSRGSVDRDKKMREDRIQGRIGNNLRVQPLSLKPKDKYEKSHLDPERYSPLRLAELRRKNRHEKFSFEPWHTIEELEVSVMSNI